MARRKKKSSKKEKHTLSQSVMLVLAGSVMTICALSVMYGFLIRKSIAEHEVNGYRIEILNGTGQKGLARDAAAAARKKGIDVFQVGNADSFTYEESMLIVRREGDVGALAQAVGCGNVVVQLKKDSFVDAALILGADYRTLDLFNGSSSDLLER